MIWLSCGIWRCPSLIARVWLQKQETSNFYRGRHREFVSYRETYQPQGKQMDYYCKEFDDFVKDVWSWIKKLKKKESWKLNIEYCSILNYSFNIRTFGKLVIFNATMLFLTGFWCSSCIWGSSGKTSGRYVVIKGLL